MSDYGKDSILALSGLKHIRMMPGMYIGGNDSGALHHLLWEVFDNSVDEALAGFCDHITLTMNKDGSITVEDNGRGIPVDKYTSGDHKGLTPVEVVCTNTNAGGKFDNDAYKFSGGLHGIGISAVNAMSAWMTVTVKRSGKQYYTRFEAEHILDKDGNQKYGAKGRPEVNPGVIVEHTKVIGKCPAGETGTITTYMPDYQAFDASAKMDVPSIIERLKASAYVNAGLKVTFRDENSGTEDEYLYPNGLFDYIAGRVSDSDAGKLIEDPIHLSGELDEAQWEAIFQWMDGDTTGVKAGSFANSIRTVDGGVHVKAAKAAITSAISKYAAQPHIGILPDKTTFDERDVFTGVEMVVSIKLPNPKFKGQTKNELINTELRAPLRGAVSAQMWDWMDHHPVETQVIAKRALELMLLRRKMENLASEMAGDGKKKGLEATGDAEMPAKLVDSAYHGELAELFITEGDSAGGQLRKAYDPEFQAYLPMRGKPLNLFKANQTEKGRARIEVSAEVQNIMTSLGCGTRDHYDESKLNFGKLIVTTDADEDGSHIVMLVIGLIYILAPDFIRQGRLLIARPPLHAAVDGNKMIYAASDEEKARLESEHPNAKGWHRFKGLGEMDWDDLRYTTLDPSTRTTDVVTMEDAADTLEALEVVFGEDPALRWDLVKDEEIDTEEVA